MLILISPAKKLDYDTASITETFTQPEFLDDAAELIALMRTYSAESLGKLMHLSANLSELNVQRYHDWNTPFTMQNAKQAILAFKGDVYAGMNADTFTEANLAFAQKHLRMLSGLYGLLKPLDLMQPYRLEMGTRLENSRGKNLYEFWSKIITNAVNNAMEEAKTSTLINLASTEYFKSVKAKDIDGNLITPQFKEEKDGSLKMIGIYAKRARGLMSRYIIDNELTDAEAIKDFNWEGYSFNSSVSKGNQWVFSRLSAK